MNFVPQKSQCRPSDWQSLFGHPPGFRWWASHRTALLHEDPEESRLEQQEALKLIVLWG